MSLKVVRANAAIIRSVGLGAQQCVECGAVYMDTELPETCANGECPTNRNSGHPSEYLSQGYREGYKEGYSAALKEVIARNAAAPKRHYLTVTQGREVELALKRYSSWLHTLHAHGDRTEADHVWELAKLFE